MFDSKLHALFFFFKYYIDEAKNLELLAHLGCQVGKDWSVSSINNCAVRSVFFTKSETKFLSVMPLED